MKKWFKFSTYELVEMAMLVAFAIILDMRGIKLQIGNNGGSISFTMVPLFILSIRQGPFKGFIGCGLIYGFITCLLDGWGFIYLPFDYLIGYGVIGLSGFLHNLILNKENKINFKGIIGIICVVIICSSLRLLSSTISGILFTELDFVASLIYNFNYIFWSMIGTIAILLILYKPLLIVNNKVNQRYSFK